MARLRHRWNNRERVRSTREITSALAANIWKIAGEAVLQLENESFEITTYSQRLDVIAEICAFLLHVVDRQLHVREDAGRGEFITELARHLARTMVENRRDSEGEGEHSERFIGVLNQRSGAFAECRFDPAEGPSFVMRRNFGNAVAAVVGDANRKWVTDFVMDIQAPAALAQLRRAMPSLFS